MKPRSLLPGLFVVVCCFSFLSVKADDSGDTNPVPAQALVPQADLSQFRQQLEVIERSNKDALEKWESLAQQSSSLSNLISGLQQSITNQREREIELNRASSAFSLKVIGGAGVAVFLVVLLSYWFQLRCFNRVMELSRSHPALQASNPALLESENSPTSKLLTAVRGLENRIQHLEVPGGTPGPMTGMNSESSPVPITTSTNIFTTETVDSSRSPSNVALLLEKGQILLDTDRLPEAISCFQEALVLDPSNSEAHFKKGIALERMNRLEQSLASYEEALRLNPKRAVAYVYKARVLAGLHRYDEALSVYDSALGKNVRAGATTVTT